jgi:hypothetical protein
VSRWDSIIARLPRFLRNSKLLDQLDAMDQKQSGTGTLIVEAHYAGGEPRITRVKTQDDYKPEEI